VQIKQQVKIKPNKQLSGYFNHVQNILVREVLLCLDKIPVVFAQTEIPGSTLADTQADTQANLSEIGNNSLGKILFQDPSMRRDKIEVTSFSAGSVLHNFCQEIEQNTDKTLWARRSLFYINNKPLLVSELFLPALGLY
jgi:chorismate--pyruvate lyase